MVHEANGVFSGPLELELYSRAIAESFPQLAVYKLEYLSHGKDFVACLVNGEWFSASQSAMMRRGSSGWKSICYLNSVLPYRCLFPTLAI